MLGTWCIGNTTVRNPYRLKGGLIAIANSPLQGNMRRQKGDKALCELLGDAGLVSYREDMPDGTFSAGRKWRSALETMGFLFLKAPNGVDQMDIGPLDFITPNGMRLVDSNSVPGEQECFFRALAGQAKTVKTLSGAKCTFNPLLHVLTIMRGIELRTGDPSISAIELAICVFSTAPSEPYSEIIESLLDLRERRAASSRKKEFDKIEYRSAAEAIGLSCTATFADYLDANTRYLKTTGLLQSQGHGLTLVPEKRALAYEWMDMPKPDWTGVDAIVNQCNGSLLPTDDADTAVRLLRQDIDSLVNYYSVSFEVPEFDPNNVADVNRIRYQAEEELDKVKEVRYAKKQKECHGEIGEYLKLLAGGKFSSRLSGDDEIAVSIPKSEAPAYMEWAVWRAFLALNSMVNKPYEARRFNVDKDFLPMSTAPGGGSDLVIEYEDFVLAVEVTLTKNSRQEAAEGEPVRRHVADLMSRYPEKDVIGLFIANGIDSNTAETFRHGTWYYPDDSKARLSIVPLTTSNFSKLFTASFEHGYTGPALIVRAIHACDAVKEGLDAPRWKQEIDVLIMDLLESGEVNYSEL